MLTLLFLLLGNTTCNPNISVVETLDDVKVVYHVTKNSNGECVPHGIWVEYCPSSSKARMTGHFNFGIPVQEWSWHDCNKGLIKSSGNYNDAGQEHGKWSFWYSNGARWQTGYFCKGLQCGEWVQWWPNGNLKSKAVWQSGKLNGRIINYYPSGQKSAEGQMNMDKKLGHWTWWDNKGNVIREKILDKRAP